MRCKNSYNVPGIGEVLFIKRSGVRRLRISVSPRNGVVVTIPARLPVSAAMAFVVEKRDWILRALRRQSERIRNSVENGKIAGVPSDPSELEHMRETARAILVPKLEAAARCHGFAYGRVAIKNNVSNWGSCSALGNINLNMRLILLPEHLQEYVILHELCHLRHPDHGPGFHAMLDSLLEGRENALRRELAEWRIE